MTIDTIFAKFETTKFISTLDLRSGYWQIPLEKESMDVCSFLINGRNYSFTRMPFGLNVNGAEFQKCMDMVLGPTLHSFVTIYVDDILITSPTAESHYKHIIEILTRFKRHHVTVNIDKCQFFRKEVSFLGHIISSEGIKMDEEKTRTIQEFRTPKNKKELQSYFGFLNFYRKFISKFAHTIQPTIELTRQNKPWKWEMKHEIAFQNSKLAFLKEVVITFPDYSKEIFLNTDASTLAVGAELNQTIDGQRHLALRVAL